MSIILSWSVFFDEIMEDLVFFLSHVIKRVKAKELAAGVTFVATSSFLFDYILYPWVIYKYGLAIGGMIMTFLSAMSCLAIISIYDVLKKDWLGMEAVKELGKDSRIVSWFFGRGKIVQFIGLSLWKDPFITTAFLRKGKFNGLSTHDWVIFWSSVVLSNGFWILCVFAGINIVINISDDVIVFFLFVAHGYFLRKKFLTGQL